MANLMPITCLPGGMTFSHLKVEPRFGHLPIGQHRTWYRIMTWHDSRRVNSHPQPSCFVPTPRRKRMKSLIYATPPHEGDHFSPMFHNNRTFNFHSFVLLCFIFLGISFHYITFHCACLTFPFICLLFVLTGNLFFSVNEKFIART